MLVHFLIPGTYYKLAEDSIVIQRKHRYPWLRYQTSFDNNPEYLIKDFPGYEEVFPDLFQFTISKGTIFKCRYIDLKDVNRTRSQNTMALDFLDLPFLKKEDRRFRVVFHLPLHEKIKIDGYGVYVL